jgi:hypothetical protein
MNCDYTILPTKGYNPAMSKTRTTTTTASSLSSASAGCMAHVEQGLGDQSKGSAMYLDVNVTDAHGTLLGVKLAAVNWSGTMQVEHGVQFPYALVVTPQLAAKNSLTCQEAVCEQGVLDFSYHSQKWSSNSSQCSVGSWADATGSPADLLTNHLLGNDFDRIRLMDCEFDCS